jgi:hypothetical protein
LKITFQGYNFKRLKALSGRLVLSAFSVTIATIERSVTIWFKRQFGNLSSALRAGPTSLNHRWALAKIFLKYHFWNFFLALWGLNWINLLNLHL